MFSGLIREMGEVLYFRDNALRVKCDYTPKIGDSIAVNGVCLTAISIERDGFVAQLSKETQTTIVLENFKAKSRVHIEPALRADSRLDGHIVQGHIDGVGVIESISHQQTQSTFFITTAQSTLACILPKGSVCVDGVSLTIGEKQKNGFYLTIIPHTLKNTLFCEYKVSRKVNIETDMFVRNAYGVLRTLLKDSPDKTNDALWEQVHCLEMQY